MVHLKRGRSKVAAEAVASHSDLLSEILLRLPAKSLVNFKTVSREWYDLISSNQFRLEHTRRNLNPRPHGMFFTRTYSTGYVRYFKFHEDYRVKTNSRTFCKFPKGLFVIDSCNGLLLCSQFKEPPRWKTTTRWDAASNLYVCNPTTKQVATIPQVFHRKSRFKNLILCFDPSTPEKYSVICLWDNEKEEYVIDVYESETGSWRHSGTFSEDGYTVGSRFGRLRSGALHLVDGDAVFWNGAVHWVDWKGYALNYFYLNQECFRRSVLLPSTSSTDRFDIRACQGHFYVSKVDGCSCPIMLTVYEMEHDFSCLSVKYTIRHAVTQSVGTQHRYHLSVIGIFLGEEGEAFIVARIGSEIYTYNVNVSNSVPSQTTLCRKYQIYYDYIFTGSLAPV